MKALNTLKYHIFQGIYSIINLEISDKNIPFAPKTKFMTDIRFSVKLVGKKIFKFAVALEVYGELI